MQQLLLFSLLLFGHCFAQAQNWQPIRWDEQYNYESCISLGGGLLGDKICDHPVWVDSVAAIGNDSIFYLNRIWLESPTSADTFISSARFLQKQCIKKPNGIYWFTNPDTFILPAQIQQTWAFTPDSSVWASTDTVIWGLALDGQLDSIRYISLSSGDTVVWSKNYGILQFPHFGGGQNYRLIGIEGNRNVGEMLESWRDYFNFDVGDIFVYSINADNPFYGEDCTSKVTVLSKNISPDTFIYNIETIIQCWTMPSGSTPPWQGTLYNSTAIFHERNTDLPFHWWRWMNNYTNVFEYRHSELLSFNEYFVYTFYIRTADNTRKKVTIDFLLDTTQNAEIITKNTKWEYFQTELVPNFGYTHTSVGAGESTGYLNLAGYYDAASNTSHGSIPSSSYLLGLIESPSPQSFTCYPNPTATSFKIIGIENQVQPIILNIYTTNGILIQSQFLSDINNWVGVEQLPAGLYIVEIQNAENRFAQKLSILR